MNEVTIYHNPRCSNSRGALALLEEHGCSLRVIEYLNTPLNADEVAGLLQRYDGEAQDFIRFKEPQVAALGLSPESSAETLVAAIVAEPILLQRPVVVMQDRVVIARPPDVLLPLLATSDTRQNTGS
jgi:arsenate reductase (glutaredoxin)